LIVYGKLDVDGSNFIEAIINKKYLTIILLVLINLMQLAKTAIMQSLLA